MKRRIGIVALILGIVVGVVGCPAVLGPGLSGTDPDIVGSWTGDSTVPGSDSLDISLVFSETQFDLVEATDGAPKILQGVYGVDATVSPRKIDLFVKSTSTNAKDYKNKNLRGVYEFRQVNEGTEEEPEYVTQLRLTYVSSSALARPLGVDGGPVVIEVTPATR